MNWELYNKLKYYSIEAGSRLGLAGQFYTEFSRSTIITVGYWLWSLPGLNRFNQSLDFVRRILMVQVFVLTQHTYKGGL